MEIEREVVDLYRALLMRDRIGDVAEGTVTGLVGSGVFVALDDPFVEVLVRFEAMGADRYEMTEDELSVVGARSGDTIALGDRMVVTIEDVAVLRRTVYAARVVPEGALGRARKGSRALARPRVRKVEPVAGKRGDGGRRRKTGPGGQRTEVRERRERGERGGRRRRR